MTEKNINSSTKLYGLVGNPVGHSLSPIIYNYLFDKYNLNSVYLSFEIKECDFKKAVDGLKALGAKGFNITAPYKNEIIKCLDEISWCADIVGSVNTISCIENKLYGFNTDLIGMIKWLKSCSNDLSGKRAVVFGSGAIAATLCFALEHMGIDSIYMINRTENNANKIKKKFEKKRILFNYGELNYDNAKIGIFGSDIIIDATSTDVLSTMKIEPDIIKENAMVIDVKYNPKQTGFIEKARNNGINAFDGTGLLVYQAIKAFEVWTGINCVEEYEKVIAKLDLFR